MADKVFAETKGMKKINLKAIICFMLVLVTIVLPFADSMDIDAVAEAYSDTQDNIPSIEIVTDGATAHFYLKNCIGLTTADFSVKLNASVVSSVEKEAGKDFSNMQKYSSELSNFAMLAVNTKKFSDIRYSLIFADELYSSEMFNEKADGCGINGEYFHFATLKMELKEGYTASDIKISAKGTATFGTKEQKDIRCIVSGNEAAPDNTAHSHKYASKSSNKDDCTKAGTKTFTCVCGDSYSEKIPARDEHKLSWRVVKNATSFKEGKKEAKCKNCDYKETSAIEKLPEIAVKAEKKSEIKLSGKDKLLSISGTKVSDMIDAVPENTVVQTADGKEAERDTLIATGMKIVMKDNKGKAIDTRVVIVPGDVDCDGTVTASDARNALRKSVELESLDIYQTAAADIQQDANVGADDARAILRNSVGLEKSKEIFKNIA